jgi:hypothetical protein
MGRHDNDDLASPSPDDREPNDIRHQPSSVLLSPCPSSRIPDSTAGSLAPELLQLIFEEACADHTTQASHDDEDGKSALDTSIKLSHVCTFWREVALNTPSLWITIDRFSEEFEIFVNRSKGLSISIHVRASPISTAPVEIKFPAWLQNSSSRVREISAVGSAETVQNLFQRVGISLPALVSLKLRVFEDNFAIPQISTPNLRRLNLRQVSARFGDYAGLTHLTLLSLYSEIKAAELISLLTKCPRLFVLSLIGVDLNVAGGHVWRINDVVELAHLQRLNFEQVAMSTVVYLLSRICVPSCAPLVRKCYTSPSPDKESGIEVVACSHIALGGKIKHPDPIITFHVGFPHDSRDVFSDVNIPMTAVDTSVVTSLLFVAPSSLYAEPPPVDAWINFLARLPSLTGITTDMPRKWTENFIMGLCNNEPEILCPQLNSLTIIDVDRHEPPARADLRKLAWQYLNARVQSGADVLENLALPWGMGDDLDWDAVTRVYVYYVSGYPLHSKNRRFTHYRQTEAPSAPSTGLWPISQD